MINRLTIVVSVLTMLAGCATRERSASASPTPTPLPSRVHRIALAELHRVTHLGAQAQAHRNHAHNHAPVP